MIELVFLTNSSVICFSCARSSSERQLAVIGDKTKIKTVTCKKRTKTDVAGMRAIVFFYLRLYQSTVVHCNFNRDSVAHFIGKLTIVSFVGIELAADDVHLHIT